MADRYGGIARAMRSRVAARSRENAERASRDQERSPAKPGKARRQAEYLEQLRALGYVE